MSKVDPKKAPAAAAPSKPPLAALSSKNTAAVESEDSFFDGVKKSIGKALTGWIDRHLERPFALPKDGFVAFDSSGRAVGGRPPGTRILDMDVPRTGLDPVLRLIGGDEKRDVRYKLPDGRLVSARTDKDGREVLNFDEMGASAFAGVDKRKGGLLNVGVETPRGQGTQASVLALPRDYDGPIFISDIDDTLRDTSISDVVMGKTQKPIPGSRELLEQVAAQGIPIVYLSAGTERIRPTNENFLAQMPPGIVLDNQDFGVEHMLPINSKQARDQAAYKSATIAELKAAFPRAQFFGLGDDKYGDAIAYTNMGVKAYIHDVRAGDANIPAGFNGVKTNAYDSGFIDRVVADLKAAVAASKTLS